MMQLSRERAEFKSPDGVRPLGGAGGGNKSKGERLVLFCLAKAVEPGGAWPAER